jgi:hypothetical protein
MRRQRRSIQGVILSVLFPQLHFRLMFPNENFFESTIEAPGLDAKEINIYLDFLGNLQSLKGTYVCNVFGLKGIDLIFAEDSSAMIYKRRHRRFLEKVISSVSGSTYSSLLTVEQALFRKSRKFSLFFPFFLKVLIFDEGGRLSGLKVLRMPYKEYLGSSYPSVLMLRDSLIHTFSPDKRRKFYSRSLPLLTVLNNEQHIMPEGSLFKLLPKELFHTIMNMVNEDEDSWTKLRLICKNFPIIVKESSFNKHHRKMSLWNPICEEEILEFTAAALITISSVKIYWESSLRRLVKFIQECFPRNLIDIGILLENLDIGILLKNLRVSMNTLNGSRRLENSMASWIFPKHLVSEHLPHPFMFNMVLIRLLSLLLK